MTPLYKNDNNSLRIAGPSYVHDKTKRDKKGYCIVSGRYGYFTLALALLRLVMPDTPEIVPEYWDYQAKIKYYLSRSHALTFLFIGNSDYLRLVLDMDKEDFDREYEDDPLMLSIDFKTDQRANTQAVYYTFQPSKKLYNSLLVFSALNRSHMYIYFEGENIPDALSGININSYPNYFGIKNNTKFEWWEEHSELRTGIEFIYYDFSAKGRSLYVNPGKVGAGWSSVSNEAFRVYQLDEDIVNRTIGWYAENKFTFGGLIFVPGVRSDYLDRSKVTTVDPRAMVSYEFPWETTISAAAGKYSYFFQVNPAHFNNNMDIAKLGKVLKPEQAIHRVIGVEQKAGLYTFRVETFYNNFYDRPMAYPHTNASHIWLPGMSSGKTKTYGLEIMVRKDRLEDSDGLFGWLSYTYTRARSKSGLPTRPGLYGNINNMVGDPWGDQWIDSNLEQRHSIKLTAGYIYGGSTISCRLQLYTSFPYTPIVGSEFDQDYFDATTTERHVAVYGEKNSAHYPVHHTLDLRYSYKTHHSWGYVNWYIEVINVYNKKRANHEYFDRSAPYEKGANPDFEGDQGQTLQMFPGFGVEIKF